VPGEREIAAGRRMHGAVQVPPSKSVTNRYLTLALLAERAVTLERPLMSEDTLALLGALESLGWQVERRAEELLLTPGERPRSAGIDCGSSGTMARFLAASLASLDGDWRLDGSPRLRERPLGPLLDSMKSLGARVACEGAKGFLPLQIEGGSLGGGRVAVDAGASSQFVSALLIAATGAAGRVRLVAAELVSAPYVDLTVDALQSFGAQVSERNGAWTVEPGLEPADRYRVEGDYSSACYLAAAAVVTGGSVVLEGARRDSRQGDRRFMALLERMGATVSWSGSDQLAVSAGDRFDGIDVDMSEIPDQVPTLAALAPFAAGTTTIRNVAHLRIKESDRLAACANELGRLGASVEELADGLVVRGTWNASAPPGAPVRVETWDDHRIAMSFALLGLRRPGVSIADPRVVAKSYPDFWEDLESCLTE
jgi:3-phosphoshikimate 1-carboxyvinyltransferase